MSKTVSIQVSGGYEEEYFWRISADEEHYSLEYKEEGGEWKVQIKDIGAEDVRIIADLLHEALAVRGD